MKINNKIVITSKYNNNIDSNEVVVDFNSKITIIEALTLIELGRKNIMTILDRYVELEYENNINESELNDLMKKTIDNFIIK